MRPTRKCEFCGKTFVPRSGMQKYCSEECQAEAKRLRKKRQQDLINGIEPIMELQHQEYLTFSKAAILMGCTRQYIYKLVANGKLKASRLSSRMAFVRKADIEKMFEGNPYKRVVPASKSKLCKKAKTEKPTQNQEPTKGKEENEVLDYYSVEEVMSIYKVKKSWLEKAREFDPFGHAGLTPSGIIRLTPSGKIKMTPVDDTAGEFFCSFENPCPGTAGFNVKYYKI